MEMLDGAPHFVQFTSLASAAAACSTAVARRSNIAALASMYALSTSVGAEAGVPDANGGDGAYSRYS